MRTFTHCSAAGAAGSGPVAHDRHGLPYPDTAALRAPVGEDAALALIPLNCLLPCRHDGSIPERLRLPMDTAPAAHREMAAPMQL